MGQPTIVVSELEESKLSGQLEVDPRTQNGLELKVQFDQLRTFRSEELEKIPEANNNNEVSTSSDYYTQSRSKLLVESLMTLVEPLPKKEEATKRHSEILPQYIEYIDLGPLEPRLVLKLFLDLIVEEELLAIRRISHIMVPYRKYFEEESESHRKLQTHVKIRTEIG